MPLPPVRTKILLVENQLDALHACAPGLQQIGYVVDIAVTGAEGLNLALNEEFDLVAINLDQPGTNGFETAGYLRQDFRYNRIPFLFITERPDAENQRRAGELGVTEFLIKPFATSDLILLIVTLVRPVKG